MKYILASNEEQIAKEWKKYKGYTVRPLPSTENYYEKSISDYKDKGNFMVYGGTPEIRSIFQKSNLNLTVIDRSEEIIRALGLLTHSKMPISNNEKFIKFNWLELDKLNNKFDLIIGDDAINMVNWDNFELFLKNAFNILSESGVFICHLLVKPDDDLINKKFLDVFKEYKDGLIKTHYDLASRLNYICFDSETYKMSWKRTIEIIGANNLDRFMPDFDFVQIFGLCNSQFYCPPINEFEKLIDRYFTVKEIFYSHEHEYCRFEPIYLLEKKN